MNDQFDEDMRNITRTLPPAPTLKAPGNGIRHNVTPLMPATHYDFETLGRDIADGLVQSAQEQLIQAENMLKQTQVFAESMRASIAAKAKELADMNERMRKFGASILEAHKKFHGEEPARIEGPQTDDRSF